MTGSFSSDDRHTRRILGIDVARALAVLGMLAIHVGPRSDGSLLGDIYNLPHGRASILFVLIAGVSIALQTRNGGLSDTGRGKLIWLAIVLLPLGLALQGLDHNVAVIIHHYAAFYLLGLCVAELPRRALLGLAITTTVLAPQIYFYGRLVAPEIFARDAVGAGSGGWEIVRGLLVSGPYPLLIWSSPLLWGLWIGRHDLKALPVKLVLFACGATVAITAAGVSGLMEIWLGEPDGPTDWRTLLADTPHSQMPLWLIGSIGSAMAVFAACLMLVTRPGPVSGPFVALGQMALSFYVAHLIALHALNEHLPASDVGPAIAALVLFGTVGLAFAALWHRHFTKGPLEALLVAPFSSYPKPPRGSEPRFESLDPTR